MPELACQSFCTVEDVLAAPCGCAYTEVDQGGLIQELIDEASDFLYVASGGRVHGMCERTVYPISNGFPCGPAGWKYGFYGGDILLDPIPLPGPSTTITEVKIDGLVLNASEYGIYNGTYLFRREGSWPTTNDITKADTEEGTFTITYTFGLAPSRITVMATVELVCQMMKDPTTLSRLRGVTSANVQGVSVSLDAADEAEALGIPAVGRFLDRFAPRGLGAIAVWSPELDNNWSLVTVS